VTVRWRSASHSFPSMSREKNISMSLVRNGAGRGTPGAFALSRSSTLGATHY
jgi:hypothetical protein